MTKTIIDLTDTLPLEARAHINKGWMVLEDVPLSFPRGDMEFISLLEQDEEEVSGEIMRARAAKLNCNFGLTDCVFLLENRQLIPKELKNDKTYIVFPGTIIRDGEGDLRVPFLRWAGRWILSFYWLEDGWTKRFRLVSCK